MALSWVAKALGFSSLRKKPVSRRRTVRLQIEELEHRITPDVTLSQTWVSGVGDDSLNTGSRDSPYKTFAGAISNTDAGGDH